MLVFCMASLFYTVFMFSYKDRACLLNNIVVHSSHSSISLSTIAVAEMFRGDASVPIVTGSSLNGVVLFLSKVDNQVRLICKV